MGGNKSSERIDKNMTLEISAAIIISVLSLSFSVYMGLKGNKRTDTKDTEERTEERMNEIAERTKENAIINVKLDNINSCNREIKDQVSSLVEKVDAHGDRLIKVEESVKSAHHRLNTLEERIDEKEDKK